MRLKRAAGLALACIVTLSSLGFNSMAAGTPSDWAVEEVEAAIAGGLVPQGLREGYQENITRAEYVLLALEVVEAAGVTGAIIYERPFSDILHHENKKDIVAAYNLGVINGYGDGTFKPDQYISREEIATLVVNLVRLIDEATVINDGSEIVYSDQELISDWAIRNVDYCYREGIMKGIGRDKVLRDIIDPKGTATIEQSIILLYRLSTDQEIYQPLLYTDLSFQAADEGIDPVELINEFANAESVEVADVFYDLQAKSYAQMRDVARDYLEVGHKDGSDLSYTSGNPKEVRLELKDLNNLVMIVNFKNLLKGFESDTNVDDLIKKGIKGLEEDIDFSSSNQIAAGVTLNIRGNRIPIDDMGTTEDVYVFQLLSVTD